MLRKLGKPVTLAVNKIDAQKREILAHDFHSLGFRDLFPISAEHRLGIQELLDHLTRDFPATDAEPAEEEAGARPIRVAIIGRPNVGKSTLLNALVGEERVIVSPLAGTTRDAVDEAFERDGQRFVFVDTAGIRRKGKTKLMAEKLSVVMARRHIRSAHVALMVLDASEGVVGSDATIAGYAHHDGRAVILVVNKWDISKEPRQKAFEQHVRDELKFLDYAPIVYVSAQQRRGTDRLFPLIQKAYATASKRVTTGELNRFVETLDFGKNMKVYYITQPSVRPPTFVLFTDRAEDLHFSTERMLVNRIRKQFGFEGTPVVIKTKRR
jgi:GTP-binding protein